MSHCRIFIAYTTFFLLGLLFSMQVPFVGFQPIRTSEHMAAAGEKFSFSHFYFTSLSLFFFYLSLSLFLSGVFLLLNALALLRYLQSSLTGQQFKRLFLAGVVFSAGAVFAGVVLLTYLGYVAPWSGRFYSLYDTG